MEAVCVLKEDFTKRGLDNNLILKVGDDFGLPPLKKKIIITFFC